MNSWLIFAIIARAIEGSSAIFDKLFLKKSFRNPIAYVFWLGILDLASFVLLPFGFKILAAGQIVFALFTGCVYIAAAYLLFWALFLAEASEILVLIGTLSPIATLIVSSGFLKTAFDVTELIGFAILILGSLILYLTERKDLSPKILFIVLASAMLFGFSNVFTKTVFLGTNFVTGFVLIKVGSALAVLSLLLIPTFKEKILISRKGREFHNRALYLLNRGYAGIGSLLIYYAISLGPPALVDATTGFQYLIIFLGAWMLLKEKFSGRILFGKIVALAIISLGLIWLGGWNYLKATAPDPARPISWGVTFSEKFSVLMGLDWKRNYGAILDDLGAKHLRLIAYWDLVEPAPDKFDFSDLDYQMSAAEHAGAKVILAVGQKLPRWPECHEPSWAQNEKLKMKNEKLLKYIEAIVERYKNSPALLYWQVENEPFLAFGECPVQTEESLKSEIAFVKSLDGSHRVLVTDGGEFGRWYRAARDGDVFGTTMYRRVYSPHFGALDYHLPPEFFRLKEKAVRALIGDKSKKFIVIELGAEPWLLHQLYETRLEDQLRVFDLPFFGDTISYAKAAGFDEYYLWGAEWWWWMKTKHGDSSFWNFAKTVVRLRSN